MATNNATARILREFNPRGWNLRPSNPADWTRYGAPIPREEIESQMGMMRESLESEYKRVEFVIARNAKMHAQLIAEGQDEAARDIPDLTDRAVRNWLEVSSVYLRKLAQAERFLA